MLKKFLLTLIWLFIFFQMNCSLHSGSTYDRGEMGGLGSSQVSDDGAISAIGAIGGAIVGGMVCAKAEERIMRDNTSEFIIQPDADDAFTLI